MDMPCQKDTTVSLMAPAYSLTVMVAMSCSAPVTSWRGRRGRRPPRCWPSSASGRARRRRAATTVSAMPVAGRDAAARARRAICQRSVATKQTKANGTRYFQQSVIIWSTRMRGSVQRIQTMRFRRTSVFTTKTPIERTCRPHQPRPGRAPRRAPPRRPRGRRPGTCQPPRKSVTAMARHHPEVARTRRGSRGRSGTPSTRRGSRRRARTRPRAGRTGVRLPSASCAMKKMTKATVAKGFVKTNHSQGQPPCARMIPCIERVPGHEHRHHDRDAGRDLVGDDLRGGAHAAEERPLGVRRPAGEQDADHDERGDRDDVEDADVEVGRDEALAEGQRHEDEREARRRRSTARRGRGAGRPRRGRGPP